MSEDVLRRKLARMQQQVDILEAIIEDRAREVFQVSEQLRASAEFLEDVYRTMPGTLFVVDEHGTVESANAAAAQLLDYPSPRDLVGLPAEELSPAIHAPCERGGGADVARVETTLRTRTGAAIPVLMSISCLKRASRRAGCVCVAVELRERPALELELRHAQKLESVGRLAAGIAHEINTPTQFVSDSVFFVRDAVNDLFRVIESHGALRDWATRAGGAGALLDAVRAVEEEVDLEYITSKLPRSLDRVTDGLGRIATIVRSMKQFAHPDQTAMTTVDLNQAIQTTLAIARNEYKYVADVETDLGDLPGVTCHAGEVNQVILNIVVNAAHAIEDVVKGTGQKGRIVVRTRRDGDDVLIEIADTGGGIPDAIRDRVFDPFFTTKGVGRGTGQGLAIARSVVVNKHGGALTFTTAPGEGTTFSIRLPVAGRRVEPDAEVAA